ncbi:MAG: hypothetical protein H7Z21_08605 [Hymenobacter sp.]|nr:hypothetical protein [Hymenobacter sp.]
MLRRHGLETRHHITQGTGWFDAATVAEYRQHLRDHFAELNCQIPEPWLW